MDEAPTEMNRGKVDGIGLGNEIAIANVQNRRVLAHAQADKNTRVGIHVQLCGNPRQ